jgi:hypothetical protein
MQQFHFFRGTGVFESSRTRRFLLLACCWLPLSALGCAAGACHDQLATPGDRDRDLTSTGDDQSNRFFFKDEYSAGTSYEPCDWSCRAHENPGDTDVHAAGACRCSTKCPCWAPSDR